MRTGHGVRRKLRLGSYDIERPRPQSGAWVTRWSVATDRQSFGAEAGEQLLDQEYLLVAALPIMDPMAGPDPAPIKPGEGALDGSGENPSRNYTDSKNKRRGGQNRAYALGLGGVVLAALAASSAGILLRQINEADGWQILFYRSVAFVVTLGRLGAPRANFSPLVSSRG